MSRFPITSDRLMRHMFRKLSFATTTVPLIASHMQMAMGD